ncbi:hypothetical protein [Pinirhizobacter soli]|uniref:hypothetical protein n=1 Tax=Pinirhizobacter soli TaxID=2786953 RepID=UPI00202A9E27|nr:hypothetical protein [Pinirhizobacter soli]
MELKKAWENRDLFTSKASEITRQLGFSGIAVIWIFKNGGTSNLVPDDLVLPLFLLVLTLLADLLHYIAGSLEWQLFTSRQEKKTGAKEGTDNIADAPAWLNYPHTCFFYSKLVLLVASYAVLIHAMSARL